MGVGEGDGCVAGLSFPFDGVGWFPFDCMVGWGWLVATKAHALFVFSIPLYNLVRFGGSAVRKRGSAVGKGGSAVGKLVVF